MKANLIWVRELALQGPEQLGNSEVFTIKYGILEFYYVLTEHRALKNKQMRM